MKLSNFTLKDLPAAVKRPTYDRAKLSPGIVHVGLGNFHRGHQAWYQHRLFEMGLDHDWAIVGAGVRPFDEAQRKKMAAQDFLTTLIELDPAGKSAEVIGPMIDYLPVEAGNDPLIRMLADPMIRIVTLTLTEGGYFVDPATRVFDFADEDIRHDAANPDKPRTAFGAIVAGLKLRRERGIGPFTIQSCDNLQGNGDVTRRTVVNLAQLADVTLADWIQQHCTFPNSMVDCIVPATGEREIALAREFGIDDAVPVTHENFRQWVIEDEFCAGRPHWEKVGVTFTKNVHDYETQKIRILNAGHQIIANIAELLHLETVSEAMHHQKIHAFFRKVQMEEVVPHVPATPETTARQYVDLVEQRFRNTAIVDTIRRVCFDGSSRHPGMILPTVRDGLAKGVPTKGLAIVEAAWARMCAGTREDGSTIEPNDPYWDNLTTVARLARLDPSAWLEMRSTYGSLADDPRFARAFEESLSEIWAKGIEAVLDAYCQS
jgi:mannitol 2-dehydrogenase